MILSLSKARVACRPFKCLLPHAFDIFVIRSVLFCTICSGNFYFKTFKHAESREKCVNSHIYPLPGFIIILTIYHISFIYCFCKDI